MSPGSWLAWEGQLLPGGLQGWGCQPVDHPWIWVFGVAAAAPRGALVVLTLVGLCFWGEERCLPVLLGLVLKSFGSSRRRREITYWCGQEQVCENQHPGTRSNNVVFSSCFINQRSNLSLSGEVSHWEGDKLPSSP